MISRILWGFNIQKKRNSDGSVIEPTTRMMPGFLSVPTPFECDISCRSEEHRKLIEEGFESINFDNLTYKGEIR